MCACVCVYACVCVIVREREWDNAYTRATSHSLIPYCASTPDLFHQALKRAKWCVTDMCACVCVCTFMHIWQVLLTHSQIKLIQLKWCCLALSLCHAHTHAHTNQSVDPWDSRLYGLIITFFRSPPTSTSTTTMLSPCPPLNHLPLHHCMQR